MTSPRSLGLVVPGNLDARTGGYLYDRHVVDGLRALGWRVDVRELDEGFPFPSAAAREDARRVLAAFADGEIVLLDSLALGALPEELERESRRLRLVGLMHLPLAADVTRDASSLAQLLHDERRALAALRLVIVTGHTTIGLLAPHGVPAGKIAVVEPGTQRANLARGSRDATIELLSVATLNAGKGYDVLLRALEPLRSRPWRLTCVGSATREPATAGRLRSQIADLGFADRVTLTGELDAEGVARAYDGADLFVTATLRETYGMAVAEALARGLPVIGTRTGAIADLVGADAGLVVAPGDAMALSAALAAVLDDPGLRARLAAGARGVRERLPTWDQAIGRMAALLSQIANS